MKIEAHDLNFLKLLLRSPDRGEGWRTVSPTVWQLVESFGNPELIEKDGCLEKGGRVRLTDRGATLCDYI